MDKRRQIIKKGFVPLAPPKDNLYQWINGDFYDNGTYDRCDDKSGSGLYALREKDYTVVPAMSGELTVGTFDGSNYLTINKTQTITSEYKLFFEAEFIPESPDGTEVLFNGGSTSNNLFIESSGALKFFGNGLISALSVGTANLGQVNHIALYIKSDSMKATLNGVEVEHTGLSWTFSTWSGFYFGARSTGSLPFSGKMWNAKDYEETWTLNNTLEGSLGNTAALTGSTEAVLFADGIQRSINLNPTGDATLTGYGYDGTFQTRGALDALYNGSTIFPAPPSERPKFLSFSPATTDAPRADKYTRR